VSEAIWGLVGVLVGGGMTWVIEIWRARRSDTDAARVAARLVAAELETIDNVRTVGAPAFLEQKDRAMKQDAWVAHRTTLARELSDDGWRDVRRAYDALAAPQQSSGGEKYVGEAYADAMAALDELMTSNRRYWWQRLALWLRPTPRGS
jgi:hypothetical protein